MEDHDLREFRSSISTWCCTLPANCRYYIQERLPILRWLPRYSRQWIVRDFIAGVTVGLIIIPQAMSYANIATLPVQYGLYSAYIGALFYVLMGTSREVDIGPTSVISLITASLIGQYDANRTNKDGIIMGLEGHQLASLSCLASGAIVLFLGLFRLGMVLDFIPETVLAGFTTGSAITIMSCQVPKWLGTHGVNNHDRPFVVLFNSLRAIPTLSWMDATFGISSLICLVLIGCIADRWSRHDRTWLRMLKISRFFIVTALATVVSFMILSTSTPPLQIISPPTGLKGNDGSSGEGLTNPLPVPLLSILKTVPAGLPVPSIPPMDWSTLQELAPKIIAIVLIMVLEHIAVAKSFAQQSQYQIDTSQELMTLGLANFTASFFGAYAVTGAFSRSAVKHQCSVKSPLSGLFTASLVLIAIHFLTPLFYYIPDSALAAVIIVAVSNLIRHPRVFIHFYKVSLCDFFTSQITLWTTLFVSVEMGIIAGVGSSLIVMLFRVARPNCYGLRPLPDRPDVFVDMRRLTIKEEDTPQDRNTSHGVLHDSLVESTVVSVFDPRNSNDILPAGVLVVRIDEAALFPSINIFRSLVLDEAYLHTRFGGSPRKPEDRLWSDNREVYIQRLRQTAALQGRTHDHGETNVDDESLGLPRLAAVIIDCSAMNHIDSSGLDGLVRLRDSLEEYAGTRDDSELFFELHFVAVKANVLRVLRQSTLLQRSRLVVNRPTLLRGQITSDCENSEFSSQYLSYIDESGSKNDRKARPRREGSIDSGHARDYQVTEAELTRIRRVSRTVQSNNTDIGTGDLVHWTIRDAVDAILEHGREWAAVLEMGTIVEDRGEGGESSHLEGNDSMESIDIPQRHFK